MISRRGAPLSEEIRYADLIPLAKLIGTDYRAVTPHLDPDTVIAHGFFRLRQVRPGLLVHSSDTYHLRAVTTRLVKQKSLTFSVALNGHWQGRIGGSAIGCGGRTPEGILFSCAEPELWLRTSSRGAAIRMVNVIITPDWLEAEGLAEIGARSAPILSFWRRHLARRRWQPSGRLVALAEQVLSPPDAPGFLQKLYMESRAIEIVTEALASITGAAEAAPFAVTRPSDYRRMRAVRDLIEAELAEPLSLGAIARSAGMSVTTLQRRFQAVHGMTVVDYLRARRLQRARERLEREGVSVAQAAYGAGYRSPANFATAFKRRFGMPPKWARARD